MAVTQSDLITDVTRIIQDSSYDSIEQLTFLNQAMQEVAGHPSVLLQDLETEDDIATSTTNPYTALPSNYQKNLFYVYNASKYWEVAIRASLGDMLRRYHKLDQSGSISSLTIRGRYLHYQRIPSSAETLEVHYYRKPYDMATLTGGSDISFTASTLRIADAGNDLGDFYAGQTIDITGTTSNNTSFVIDSVESDGSYLTTTVAPTDESNQSAIIKSRPDGIPEHLIKPLLLNHACSSIFSEIEEGVEGNKTNTLYHDGKFKEAMGALIGFIGPEGRRPQPINDEMDMEAYV
jgi:hypothetical protein